jgi:hypothetical protein
MPGGWGARQELRNARRVHSGSTTGHTVQLAFQPTNPEGGVSMDSLRALYQRYLDSMEQLAPLLQTGVRHHTDGVHDRLWLDVLQRLVDAGTAPLQSFNQALAAAPLRRLQSRLPRLRISPRPDPGANGIRDVHEGNHRGVCGRVGLAFRRQLERSRSEPCQIYLGGANEVDGVLVANREVIFRGGRELASPMFGSWLTWQL